MKILNAVRFLISFLHRQIWIVVLLAALVSVLLIPVSFMVKIIFDRAIPQADISLLLKLALGLAILMISSGVLSVYARAAILRHTKRAVSDIRNALSKKLLGASHGFYQQADLARIHKILVYDTEKLDNFANAVFSVVIPSACISFGLTVILIVLNWQLTALLFVIAPFIIIITKFLRRACNKSLIAFQSSFEEFHKRSFFLLEMNKLIKVSSTQRREAEVHKNIVTGLETSSLDMALGYSRMSNYQDVIFSTASIALLAWGSYQVMYGQMTIGTLMSFYFCLFLLRKYLTGIGNVFPAILEGTDSLTQCTTLLSETKDEIYNGTSRPTFDGRIACKDVTFSFGTLVLFRDFNMALKPGTTTLVMGPNGSGKSTLVNLILGLYKPNAGELTASDVAYPQWDIQHLRGKMAVVLQEDTTFQGSLLDNITYGMSDVHDDDIRGALHLSGLLEFSQSLPNGVATMIGDKGTRLSGGQRQKIAIARCILAKAPLIILDEPTNHLDQHSIAMIANTLKTQNHRPSVLIISHDSTLSTLADEIIELRKTTNT